MQDDEMQRLLERIKRQPTDFLNEIWIRNHLPWYLIIFVICIATYIATIRSFHGNSALSDTVGATGVLASVITLLVVIFQIDVALRIARTQTEIADRELRILERQDEDMRRPPDLRLQYSDGYQEGTHNRISMSLSNARAKVPVPVFFSILNRGKTVPGVSVELWLPEEMTLAQITKQSYDWRQFSLSTPNSANPRYGSRTYLETLRLYEGFPVDLAPIYFVFEFPRTAGAKLPAPLILFINYRLKAEAMTWPGEGRYGRLRLVAFATLEPDSPNDL